MKTMLFLMTLGFSFVSFAVNPNEIPEYNQKGNLISLRIVPKDRTAKIFLVGNKAAEVDLKKDAKILSVSLLKKNQQETLQMDRQGDFYEVKGLPPGQQPYDLMIKTEVRGQPEEMKVEIRPKKP